MNRRALLFLLVAVQPIFSGGTISSLFQGQTETEQDNSNNTPNTQIRPFESSSDVSFSCNPNNGDPEFKVSYVKSLNGVRTNSSFSWKDASAKDNCNAIERKLAAENDPFKRQALVKALTWQRAFQGLK